MPADRPEITRLTLPRIGAAIAGAALICPALTVPLVIACVAVLGKAALDESRADNLVPEMPPAKKPRKHAGHRAEGEGDTEDSFPASDPPSWTPVTGTGSTRH